MATLDLQPNLGLIVAHGALFLGQTYAIKKLIVTPYIRLRDSRQKLETESKNKAADLTKGQQAKEAEIEAQRAEKLRASANTAKKQREELLKQQDQKLKTAKENAAAELAAFNKEITAGIKEEQQKLQKAATNCAQQILGRLT